LRQVLHAEHFHFVFPWYQLWLSLSTFLVTGHTTPLKWYFHVPFGFLFAVQSGQKVLSAMFSVGLSR
jgi:hypothetical protein